MNKEFVALTCEGYYQWLLSITKEEEKALANQCQQLSRFLKKNISIRYGFGDEDFKAQGYIKDQGGDSLYDTIFHKYEEMTRNIQKHLG